MTITACSGTSCKTITNLQKVDWTSNIKEPCKFTQSKTTLTGQWQYVTVPRSLLILLAGGFSNPEENPFARSCNAQVCALRMSKEGLGFSCPCPREFFGFPIFHLRHRQYHSKGSMDLAREGRDVGDPLCVGAWYYGSAPSWPAHKPCPKLNFLRLKLDSLQNLPGKSEET